MRKSVEKFLLLCIISVLEWFVKSDEPDCSTLPNLTMLPDPAYCRSFLICLNGELKSETCPNGMFFNIDISTCDSGECIDKPSIEDGIECPAPNVAPLVTYVPSNEKCYRYFMCVNGIPFEFTCRDGLYFNPVIDKCDFRENVECEFSTNDESTIIEVSTTEDSITTEISSTIEESTTEMEENTTLFPSDENGYPFCPHVGVIFYPHPSNCNLYFACYHGFRSLVQCPFHHFWDIHNNQCVAQHQAVCILDNVKKK